MDAPLECPSEEGYAVASEYTPSFTTSYSSTFFDEWDSLAGLLSSQDSDCIIEDFCNEFYQANPAVAAAQSDCKLQPRVHSRSPSFTSIYTPPPSSHVVQLQSLPADEPLFQHDTIVNTVPPASCLPLHAADPIRPDVSAYRKPPSASSFTPSVYADTNVLYCKGKQLPKADPFPFSFSHVEAKHTKGMLPYHHAINDRPHLTSPNSSTLHSSMRSCRPRAPDVSTSRVACRTMSGGIASPAHMQSYIFSTAAEAAASLDCSAGMEMSTASAPVALPTSNASMYWTSTLPENGSLTVPASPTPSVNKGAASMRRIRSCGGIAFKVKTTLLNLHDCFTWKKYGEKYIIGSKFTRSYFKCDEKARRGCKVVKRTQKCDDGEHILFTYLGGRHNHP